MGAIANLVAYDGEATPLAHTFTPVFVRNENGKQVALYRESVSGVPYDASPTVTLSQERLAKSKLTKLTARVAIPVMESVSGQNASGYTAPPAVAYTVTGEFVMFVPGRSTTTQRKNMRYLMLNLLHGTAGPTTTSVTGPIPELIDSVVSPT